MNVNSTSYYKNLYNAYSRMYGNSGVNSSANKLNGTANTLTNLQGLAAEYKQIKSGSYKKLLNSYYEKYGSENKGEGGSGSIFDEIGNLRTVSGNASALKGNLNSLRTADFKDDAEGSLKKVKDFVDSYNSVVDNSVKVDRKGVLRDTLSMVNTTKHSAGLLKEVGITVGSDNKLTLDEDKWNSAHSTTKKTLFGTGGYGSQIMYKASQVASGAKAGTGSLPNVGYTSTGNAIKQPTAQSFLDMLF